MLPILLARVIGLVGNKFIKGFVKSPFELLKNSYLGKFYIKIVKLGEKSIASELKEIGCLILLPLVELHSLFNSCDFFSTM